jgi:hypothetical protein
LAWPNFGSLEDLLASDGVDLLIFATPHDTPPQCRSSHFRTLGWVPEPLDRAAAQGITFGELVP